MMLGKRKYGGRSTVRAGPRKRRVVRRKRMMPTRVSRGLVPRIMSIQRTFWSQNWVPSVIATSDFYRQFNFNFGALPNQAEYGALFDEYKINAIKIVLRPRYDQFAGNDTTDTTLPGVTNQGKVWVHVLRDMYGSLNPTGTYASGTLNAFLENGRVKTYDGNREVSIYYKPTVLDLVNAQVSSKKRKSQWFPMGEWPTHYGPHVFLQDINLTGVFNQSFDVFLTYYFMVRGQK